MEGGLTTRPTIITDYISSNGLVNLPTLTLHSPLSSPSLDYSSTNLSLCHTLRAQVIGLLTALLLLLLWGLARRKWGFPLIRLFAFRPLLAVEILRCLEENGVFILQEPLLVVRPTGRKGVLPCLGIITIITSINSLRESGILKTTLELIELILDLVFHQAKRPRRPI